MDKSLTIHGVLAALAVAAAYTAWSEPHAAERESGVVVIAGDAQALTSIDWHEDTSDVAVERTKDGDITVTVAHKTLPGPGAPQAVTQTYPGSNRAKELFQKLAPFRAARSLGKVDQDKLKAFGLDAPKSRLTLNFGQDAKVIEVGGTTFGSGDRYSLGPDGAVYLLQASTINDLGHGAVSLQDRELVGVPRAKVDRVTAQAGARRHEWVQRQGEDPQKAFFADPAEPDHKLDQVTTWIDRALRLRATEIVSQAPEGEPALVLEFRAEHNIVSTVKIWSTAQTAVAVASRFKGPVSLHKPSVDAVLHDLDTVLGAP